MLFPRMSGPFASGGVRLNWRELRFGEAKEIRHNRTPLERDRRNKKDGLSDFPKRELLGQTDAEPDFLCGLKAYKSPRCRQRG